MGHVSGMTHDDARHKVTELIRDGRICMFTTMTAEGRHVSRPMGLQEAEFDGDLWFFAEESSPKIAEIRAHPQVNVSFTTKKGAWVSVAGTAEVVHDRSRVSELWSPILAGWFPNGPDTPGITLIKVHAETAEYWDAPHGRAVMLIQIAAAAILRKQAPEGENEIVTLG